MQRNRHAVAAEGGNDGCLVAQPKHASLLRSGMDVAVGHAGDAERPDPARRSTFQPAGEVVVLTGECIEQGGPTLPFGLVAGPVHKETKVGDPVLDHLQSGIPTSEHYHLDMPGERRLLAATEA